MRQSNNVPFSCIVVYSICTLYCSFAFASTSFEMPSLPLSVFADTEISSNLLFKTDSTQNRNWVFSIEADVSTNNNVQAEFGVDMDGIQISGNTVTAPDRPGNFFVMLRAGKASAWLSLRCIAPTMLRGANPRPFFPFEWGKVGVDPLALGEAGVDMHIDTWLEPTYVSFTNLCLHEGYAPPTNRTGWYTSYTQFPDNLICHGASAGAMRDNESVGIFSPGNMVELGDCVAAFIGWRPVYINGSYQLSIPVRWFVKGGAYTNSFPNSLQTAWVYSNGTMRVSKNGCAMERSTNGVYTVISN